MVPFPPLPDLSIIYHFSLFYFSPGHLPLSDIGYLPYYVQSEIYLFHGT